MRRNSTEKQFWIQYKRIHLCCVLHLTGRMHPSALVSASWGCAGVRATAQMRKHAQAGRAGDLVVVLSGGAGTQRRAFGARVLNFSEGDCETLKETLCLSVLLLPGSASPRCGVPASLTVLSRGPPHPLSLALVTVGKAFVFPRLLASSSVK